ncbi:hypothetical protein EON65_07185 [archaeon]|nr:MAG: hypothetical protein EON65_07185 [archaeon]
MDRLSMQSVTTQNIKALTRMKRVKVSAALVVLLIMYSILFSTTTSDTAFLVVGGALGCFSAVSRKSFPLLSGSSSNLNSLLFLASHSS